MEKNFIINLDCILSITNLFADNLNITINKIFIIIDKIILKLQLSEIPNQEIIINSFFECLNFGKGTFAGSMDKDEFYHLISKSHLNLLNYKHVRKCVNAFWCFIKKIVTEIIYYFICKSKIDNNFVCNLEDFEKNVDTIIKMAVNFINQPNESDKNEIFLLNEELLFKLIKKGLKLTINKFGNFCILTADLLYKHILRFTHLEGRQKSEIFRNKNICGHKSDFLNASYDKIKMFLSENEIDWNGNFIFGIDENSSYHTFCKKNNLYNVSWLSGTTFELMLYALIFLNFKNEIEIKTLMILFLNFHIIRGTHSVFEVILAFYEINEELKSNLIFFDAYDKILLPHILKTNNKKIICFDKNLFAMDLFNIKLNDCTSRKILMWDLELHSGI